MEERNKIPLPDENKIIPPAPMPAMPTEKEWKAAAPHIILDEAHLPYYHYGEPAATYCKAMAQAFDVHTDLIAGAMLVAAGAAAGKRHSLHYGAYNDYPCLWLCATARTGYNKSAPVEQVVKPLKAINEQLISDHTAELKEWQAAGGDKSGQEPPHRKQLISSDVTPEQRYYLLAHNDLLYYRDELFGCLKDIGRYSASGEIEQFLTIFSAGDFSIDRRTADSYYVKTPFMAWIGGIQKAKLNEAFGCMALRGNGFLERWLFVWLQDDKVSDDVEERPLPADIVAAWDKLIQTIWRMKPQNYHLSPLATDIYHEYKRGLRRMMNDKRATDDLIGHLAKAEYIVKRIALIIHLLRFGDNAQEIIEGPTMNIAVQTMRAFNYMNWQALRRICGDDKREELTDADLIRELVRRYQITNQSALARCINRTQQYVSKLLTSKK